MVLAKPAIGAAWRFLPLSRWPLQLAELKDLCIVQLRRKANIKQTVVSNLLLNAADAMAGIEGRPRTLRVQTEILGTDSVKLLARDSGVGLDPRSIEKLFEAFYTAKAYGLGIGLAISRSIIESHKGHLWATTNDGPGATFGFTIPCASGAVTDTAGITSSKP